MKMTPFLGDIFIMQANYESIWKGYPFAIKGIHKSNGYLFCQNGIQKGKRLDLGAEPPCINLCSVPPPLPSPRPEPGSKVGNSAETKISLDGMGHLRPIYIVSDRRIPETTLGNFSLISLQNSTNRSQEDRKSVSEGETTRVGELSRLGRQGNPGKWDNFSSYKCFGLHNGDNSRHGECHIMPRFRI